MSKRVANWVIGGLVLVGATTAAFGEVSPLLRQFSLQTLFVGLAGALYQLLRDASAQEHQEFLQGRDHRFELATSHMSTRAFDEYCAFCKEYLSALHAVRDELMRKGAQAALAGSWKLNGILEEWCLWVDNSTREELEAFEFALRKMGADAEFVRATAGTGDPGRSAAIKREYEAFKLILGLVKEDVEAAAGKQDVDKNDDKAQKAIRSFDQVIDKVRLLLGLEELTQLRRKIIAEAIKV